jgi:hypothetical protein
MKTKLSITKAAKLANISRTTFYKHYLDKGTISKSKDSRGKIFIELSELLRVFPDININSTEQTETPDLSQGLAYDLSEKDKTIQRLQYDLSKQSEAFSDREKWYQGQIEYLTMRLEHQNPEKPKKGLLSRLAKAVLDD